MYITEDNSKHLHSTYLAYMHVIYEGGRRHNLHFADDEIKVQIMYIP